MKRNQLILLIVVGAVIGAVGLMLYKRESQSWEGTDQRTGQKLIKEFPLNDVAHIVIKNASNELNIVKKDDQWTVQERGGYPANFTQIRDLLQKVWSMKVAQAPNITAAQLGRFELLPPGKGTNSSTLIEFRGADGKTLQSLLLGKKHMRQSQGESPFGGGGGWPDGRYVMVGDNIKSVALISEPLNDAEPKPDSWLDKEFVKVEKIKAVSVTSTNATNNWSVRRETEQGEWKFENAAATEELDKTKVASVGTALSSASFDDVMAAAAKPAAELGLDKPRVARIETFDHLTYQVSIGTTNEQGNYYVQLDVSANPPKERTPAADEKPEDKDRLDKEFKEKIAQTQEKLKKEENLEKWVYVLSKWSIDPLLKERKDLLAEKKPDTTSVPTNNVVVPFAPDAAPGAGTTAKPPVPPPTPPPPPLPNNGVTPAPKPTEPKPTEPKPTEPKPADAKPADVKPSESKPVENKPAEPAEDKPAEPKPAE